MSNTWIRGYGSQDDITVVCDGWGILHGEQGIRPINLLEMWKLPISIDLSVDIVQKWGRQPRGGPTKHHTEGGGN